MLSFKTNGIQETAKQGEIIRYMPFFDNGFMRIDTEL